MINNLISSSYLNVTQEGSSTYIPSTTGMPNYDAIPAVTGNVRFNLISQNLEVYNGALWLTVTQNVFVDLPEWIKSALHATALAADKARQQQEVNNELDKLAAAFPAVQDAVNELAVAIKKLSTIVDLCKK